MRLLIKNGTIVTATDQYTADIFIADEKIQCIGQNLSVTADKIIDAKNKYVFPGGVDAHTHMQIPFMGTSSSDTFESGTLAALHGGTTSIIDFAIQTQGDSLTNALNKWHEMADGNAVSDYAFHVAVTDFNDKTRAEMKSLVEERGITSFKTFMAYKGALMVDDCQLVQLMEETKKYGAIVTTHAENGDIIDNLVQKARSEKKMEPKYHALTRPRIAEAEASGRFIDMAQAGGHEVYIVHMTCKDALDRVREASKRNQRVHVETCIQYLLLDEKLYDQGFEGSKWVMSPPLRSEMDREALWAGLRQNLVHVVATDHCPFCMDQKRMGEKDFSKIPNGMPGVEHRMELLYSEGVLKNKISLNKFVEVTSTAPSKIFGLFPKKGTIAVGSDADMVLFDPTESHTLSAKTHHMHCDYSAFEGWKVTGRCKTTILRGTVAIEDGKALVQKGFGKYLSRRPHA